MISIPKRVFYELLCASSSTMRECRNSSTDFSNTRPSPHCRCCIDYYSSISSLQSNTASSNDIAVGRTPNNWYVRIETDSISIYFHLFIHRLQLYQSRCSFSYWSCNSYRSFSGFFIATISAAAPDKMWLIVIHRQSFIDRFGRLDFSSDHHRHSSLSLSASGHDQLNELLRANEILNEPIISFKSNNDYSLMDVVRITDTGIRRLISMSKRLSAFRDLCQHDQIALLKGK